MSIEANVIEEESRQQAAESERGTEENTDLPGEAESIKGTDAVKQENTNKATKERPNIIFLQLESLFDPQLLKDVEFSGTVLPKLEWLYKSYPSGFLSVPSVGAGTANTEFEIISGMNLDDFGPGEYPYKTKLKNQVCESAATAFSAFGYGTHAIHNNGGNFYSRAKVFNNIGFDSFTSKEFMIFF